MGIDHRGGDIDMSEEFLHRPDVITIRQQMRGKRMAERISTLLIIRR
jgi:hypothetical protein